MGREEFDKIMKELMEQIEKESGKRPNCVYFKGNSPVQTDTNTMLLVKLSYVADDMVVESAMIVRIVLAKANQVENLFILSPIYAYEGVPKSKEEEVLFRIAELLEDILKNRFVSQGEVGKRNAVVCETGDVKIKILEEPTLTPPMVPQNIC